MLLQPYQIYANFRNEFLKQRKIAFFQKGPSGVNNDAAHFHPLHTTVSIFKITRLVYGIRDYENPYAKIINYVLQFPGGPGFPFNFYKQKNLLVLVKKFYC